MTKQQKSAGRVLVYEQLPYYLKELKRKAKTKAEEKGCQYVWVTNGKILARKSDGQRVLRILSEKDLDLIK